MYSVELLKEGINTVNSVSPHSTLPSHSSSILSLPPQVLGHGASGEVLLAIHKVTQQQFACKVVRKDTKMNDAQVRDWNGPYTIPKKVTL